MYQPEKSSLKVSSKQMHLWNGQLDTQLYFH